MADKSERELLLERAAAMGLEVPDNIPTEKLKSVIEKKLGTTSTKEESKEEQESDYETAFKEATKLIRCRVVPNDVLKRDWDGEIITVSNAVIGTIKKYVQFNEPYHLPNIIYLTLLDAKYQNTGGAKKVNDVAVEPGKLVPAYNIEVLPPLRAEELEQLRQSQNARQVTEQ